MKYKLKSVFSNRKNLYLLFGIVLIFVLYLTVVYAALSTTLNINGTAEVSAANWDIHLDNIQLNSSSATTTPPTITNSTTATFSTTLSKPGDFYEFTIDVVNNGSIDAMIDSVTKTPELSDKQKKYLNYIVEYQNGESITTKQLVEKNSFVRLKVKVEFRKDISASDLPSQSETLNLSFKVNYVQSDGNSENTTIYNNGKWPKVISGDLETVGSEVVIGDEHFYIISSNEDSVTMFAKYNLYVGKECSTEASLSCVLYGEEATGRQDSKMIGYGTTPRRGTLSFSSSVYWEDASSDTYVYDSRSNLYNYVENYKVYLESLGVIVGETRLIKKEELESLGCSGSSCGEAPNWVYSTSYWTGTGYAPDVVWHVDIHGNFHDRGYYYDAHYGVRPVITIVI